MYKPTDDLYFHKALINRDLAEESIKSYAKSVKVWYNATGKTLKETVENVKPTQKGVIQGKYIVPFNPDDGLLKEYFDNFHAYLMSTGKKNSTINYYIKVMRYLCKENGLILPKAPVIKVKKTKKQLLRKDDIRYIFSTCDIYYRSFYCFLACTGIRVSDAASFTINDWLSATFDYHHCRDLDSFLEKDHEPMIGYWEFIPQKTRSSSNIVCKTCNSYESNEYIIQSIHERIKSIERRNKKQNTNIKVEGNDPLFPTHRGFFKAKLNRDAVAVVSNEKNKKLQKKLKIELTTLYEGNELSHNQFQKLIENRPHFHAHALRSFFISTIRAYCSNRDVALTMEAHTSDIQTDENYLGESSELFNKEMIIGYYLGMINHLTFNVEIDPEQLEKLSLENQKLEREIAEVKRVAQEEAVKKVDDILIKYGF